MISCLHPAFPLVGLVPGKERLARWFLTKPRLFQWLASADGDHSDKRNECEHGVEVVVHEVEPLDLFENVRSVRSVLYGDHSGESRESAHGGASALGEYRSDDIKQDDCWQDTQSQSQEARLNPIRCPPICAAGACVRESSSGSDFGVAPEAKYDCSLLSRDFILHSRSTLDELVRASFSHL